MNHGLLNSLNFVNLVGHVMNYGLATNSWLILGRKKTHKNKFLLLIDNWSSINDQLSIEVIIDS